MREAKQIAKIPKLPLSTNERQAIRRSGLKLAVLHEIRPPELARLTTIPLQRCEKLVALSQFQTLGSVGPAIAEDLWALGYQSILDLRGANPREMYESLERMTGKPVDPCVEDVFRCAVAQVFYPDLPEPLRQWWKWTDHRGEPSVRLAMLDEVE